MEQHGTHREKKKHKTKDAVFIKSEIQNNVFGFFLKQIMVGDKEHKSSESEDRRREEWERENGGWGRGTKKGMNKEVEEEENKRRSHMSRDRRGPFENMQREIRKGRRGVTKDTVLTLFILQLMP